MLSAEALSKAGPTPRCEGCACDVPRCDTNEAFALNSPLRGRLSDRNLTLPGDPKRRAGLADDEDTIGERPEAKLGLGGTDG